MLVLTVWAKDKSGKSRDEIVIDLREYGLGVATVKAVETSGRKVRLGLTFDDRIPVHRKAVFDALETQRKSA